MENIKETIGIDVAKETLDVWIHTTQFFKQFENTLEGHKKMLIWVLKESKYQMQELLFCFEHTGLYSYPLSVFLTEQKAYYFIIPGLELKRSMGIQRGKEDKIDAKKIALYAFRKRDEIEPYKLADKEILGLKQLLTLRERLVKQRAGYEASAKENQQFLKKKDNKILFEVEKSMVPFFDKKIEKVEKELDNIIKKDDRLKKMYDLITSIKCVGPQTALFMIALTNGFTKFAKWRKFASYAGIAPFPYQSGISINGKRKVSQLANKKIKSLLNLCATSSITYNPEMKQFYKKRIARGKNKMSTINIIRNKILSRIFAVIERGSSYVDTMKYAA